MAAKWHLLTVGILPPEGVEIDAAMERRIENAIGDALGPWSMTMGFRIEPIPSVRVDIASCTCPDQGREIDGISSRAVDCPLHGMEEC